MSSTAEGGGGGAPRGGATKGAAGQRPADAAPLTGAERGMAEMSENFRAAGGEIYVSESGKKREAID